MSRLPKANETAAEAGFTLLEVLVAIVVAGLVLSALARAFETAWSATRTPAEILSAVAVAESAAHDGSAEEGSIGGYAYERRIGPVDVVSRSADIARSPVVDATEAGAAQRKLDLRLHRISVVVVAPSGRRIAFDRIRLENNAK